MKTYNDIIHCFIRCYVGGGYSLSSIAVIQVLSQYHDSKDNSDVEITYFGLLDGFENEIRHFIEENIEKEPQLRRRLDEPKLVHQGVNGHVLSQVNAIRRAYFFEPLIPSVVEKMQISTLRNTVLRMQLDYVFAGGGNNIFYSLLAVNKRCADIEKTTYGEQSLKESKARIFLLLQYFLMVNPNNAGLSHILYDFNNTTDVASSLTYYEILCQHRLSGVRGFLGRLFKRESLTRSQQFMDALLSKQPEEAIEYIEVYKAKKTL